MGGRDEAGGFQSADVRRLTHTVDLLARALDLEHREASLLLADLQQWVVEREGADRTGSNTRRWARRLVSGLGKHPAVRAMLLTEGKDLAEVMREVEKRSERHLARVAAIEQQHAALRDGMEGDSDAYSQASAHMVEEWWVRAVHDRIAQWIDEYYLLTADQVRRGHHPWAFKAAGLPVGWKRYVHAGRAMFWNPSTKRMQVQEPPVDEGRAPAPPPREPPVALLDVGSCTNPFSRYGFLVEPTAIDLRPGDGAEGVFQADFFEVPIVAREGREAGQRVLVDEAGRLTGLVANSFDVVVISLVLSYIPTPQRRIEMVARARQCLRDDRGLLFVVDVGSALADVSWYNGDAAADWSRAIEGTGFQALKFADTVREKRSHAVCQWVFETAPVGGGPLAPLRKPREMPW